MQVAPSPQDTIEQRCLAAIEPYVMLATSALITSAWQRDFSVFELLARPHTIASRVVNGVAAFELPRSISLDECFMESAQGGVHSFVKHLRFKRAAEPSSQGMRHLLAPLNGVCAEGEPVSLVYTPWFRYAAPPYDFDLSSGISEYVGRAFAHIARQHGIGAEVSSAADAHRVRIGDRLSVEVVGSDTVEELAIVMAGAETSLGLRNRQLSLSREMFPGLYEAARAGRDAGESFERLGLVLEDDQFLLYANDEA